LPVATVSCATTLERTADRATTQALPKEDAMAIDNEKVDEITLALLYLTTFKDKHGLRAWKSHDWDVLDRLHEKGLISDPKSKAKSVVLSDEAARRSAELFEQLFGK